MTHAAPDTRPVDDLLPGFPLARCARIAASIDLDPDMEADILRASDLDPDRWEALDEHWQEVILEDLRSSRMESRASYDDHYVARLEEERGPLGAADYAAIVVASERGSIEAKLAELGIPDAAMLAIERVWLRRTSRDESLARAVKDAIDEARHA
jgi:hypothetical protein